MTVDEKRIEDSWKEYMEKLINEQNERDHRISAAVNEGPADCIRINEVAAAMKKMKRQAGLSGLVAELTQDTWDIGTQWISDLCNGIVKEGCITEDWKSNVVLSIYKGKGDQKEHGSNRGIKLLTCYESGGKDLQQIEIDDMQFGFTKGKGNIGAIFIVRQMLEKFRAKGKKLYFGKSFR